MLFSLEGIQRGGPDSAGFQMARGQRHSAIKAKDDDERESDMDFSGSGSDEGHPKLDDEDDDPAEDEDDDPEPEEDMESDELSPPPSPHKPRLKIKLKLPQILSPNPSSSQSRAASTTTSRPSSHRGISRDVDADMDVDVDVESEDEDDDRDDAEDAYGDGDDGDERAGKSTHPMTSRQAVLASVVDSSHVSLSESSRKKKQLTESEMALRREETARKRKNLTEKKLEDEKAETINRLLKKQSKSKKRNALSTADDRTPVSATPAVVQTRDGSEAEGEGEPAEVVPTMYHWVSTTKSAADADEDEGRMKVTFSVPVSALPPQGAQVPSTAPGPPTETPVCDVTGCERVRKYRLVSDWVRGACGMAHLKMLELQMDVVQ